MASIVAFQAVDRGSIPCWRTFFVNSYYKNKQKIKSCQKWDSNPRPHLWTRILSPSMGGRNYPWVWRLRPLGHPDISDNQLKDIISKESFLRTKKCSRWGLNSQPPHILHHLLPISTARWPIAPLEQAHQEWEISDGSIKSCNPI